MPKFLTTVLTVIFICTSCSQSQEELNPPPPNQPASIQLGENPFPFTFFELKATYHGIEDHLLVQYRYMNKEVYVKYSDHDEHIDLDGKEAFEQVKPKLTKLSLTEETNLKQLMLRLFKQFPIRDDYRRVEVKVRFNNGEEKVFKRFPD